MNPKPIAMTKIRIDKKNSATFTEIILRQLEIFVTLHPFFNKSTCCFSSLLQVELLSLNRNTKNLHPILIKSFKSGPIP